MDTGLAVDGLSAGYARKGLALEDVSLVVPARGIVALFGANGAGKTTLIRAATGLLDLHGGHITSGDIRLAGKSLRRLPPHQRVRLGMTQVPEGRLVFKKLTVEDNLLVGAAIVPAAQRRKGLEYVYALFPRLQERSQQAAGWLSGGNSRCWRSGAPSSGGPGCC